MTNEQIQAIALANGFKLKEQPDESMALNPYVFEFANALLQNGFVDNIIQKSVYTGRIKDLEDENANLRANYDSLRTPATEASRLLDLIHMRLKDEPNASEAQVGENLRNALGLDRVKYW